MALTLKQERFAKEYVRNGGNATQAAIAAGYAARSAEMTGSRTIRNDKVLQAIAAERKVVEGPDERRWKKAERAMEQALDDYAEADADERPEARRAALTAVRELAKCLGKYAPEKVEHTVRMEIYRQYALEIRQAITVEASPEIADKVLKRLAEGGEG